jgi:pyruvate kinase
VNLLKEHNVLADSDLAIITKGDLMGTHGATNAMKIVEVGNMIKPNSEVDA